MSEYDGGVFDVTTDLEALLELDGGVGARLLDAPLLDLTVVLPCLNEAETLEICIRKAQTSMRRLGLRGEVVVADNGSTDGSQGIARSCGARVVDVPVRGYGAALRTGIAAATSTWVIMADADDSYALEHLDPFIAALREGADLVMGDRFAGGIEPGAMPALHRYLGNPVLSWLGRKFFRLSINDFHCGLRGFRRDRIMSLGMQTTGMEFASEMVVRSAQHQLRIVEVPTTLRPDGRTRAPHLRTWRDGWRHLRFLLAFSPRWLFLYPAYAMILVGLTATIGLLVTPLHVDRVTFDVQTMLVAATSLIVGIQVAALALVSRAYATRLGMMPPSRKLDRLLDRFTLEWGVLVGVLCALLGVGVFVLALLHWRSTGFGPLPARDMRVPLAGMVLIVAGVQTVLVSFTLSLGRIGEP
jgi:glycosyltransferase involved in cell wall biosynthesis